MTTERRFPVLLTHAERRLLPATHRCPRDVPWSFLAPHEQQAKRNHDQDLETLARRGGLGPDEIWAVVHGKRWREAPLLADAIAWLSAAMERS